MLRGGVIVVFAAAALVKAGAASADTELWSTDQVPTPIAAGETHIAFSALDPATKQYTLMVGDRRSNPVAIAAAPVPPYGRPFDVSIGNLRGTPTVLYSRCARGGVKGCDIYRYPLAGGGETKVQAMSSRSEDETHAALTEKGRAVFVRAATRLVPEGFGSGRGKVRVACDRVFIADLRSSQRPKRLTLPLCGTVVALATDKGRAAVIVNGDPIVNPTSTLVVLRLNGGQAKVRGRASSGPNGFSPFQAVAFRRYTIIASQVGTRVDLKSGFVTFPQPLGPPYSSPNADLIGPFAIAGEDTFAFLGQPSPEGATCGPSSPCRLVQSREPPLR